MTVKNEDDIVEDTLRNALKWADEVYIVDNGSTDNTKEVIKKVMKNNNSIKIFSYQGDFY